MPKDKGLREISNKAYKNTTYYKRKRGIVKKAMELSMLCN